MSRGYYGRRSERSPAEAASSLFANVLMGVPGVGMNPTDLRFASDMIQHHEGAIRASLELLRQGTDPEMRSLARSIVAAQEPEIAQLRSYLSRQGLSVAKNPNPNVYPSVGVQAPNSKGSTNSADLRFAASMIPHHEAAIEASSQLLQQGRDSEMSALAEKIIQAQQAEVIQLRGYLNRQGKSYVLVPPGRFDIASGLLGVAAILAAPRLPSRASSAVEMGGAMLIGASLHAYLMRVFGHL